LINTPPAKKKFAFAKGRVLKKLYDNFIQPSFILSGFYGEMFGSFVSNFMSLGPSGYS
jgi:hypothetical protein